tara:strand:- start:183 stop:431 length:249 start_codon:yes stop_codon:yes gene_type:complete
MKRTAVEWLIDESMKLVVQYMKGTLNEDTLDDVIYELGTKAKEMEKEQMFDYIKKNYVNGENSLKFHTEEFENYYNETFKSE